MLGPILNQSIKKSQMDRHMAWPFRKLNLDRALVDGGPRIDGLSTMQSPIQIEYTWGVSGNEADWVWALVNQTIVLATWDRRSSVGQLILEPVETS